MADISKADNFQCIIFLEDKSDQSALNAGVPLYGEYIPATRTYVLSPYPPPTESIKQFGVIANRPCFDYENPGRAVLCKKNDKFTAYIVIDGNQLEIPVQIIGKSAIYARTPFDPGEMKLLWEQTVLIFGLGTGGVKIALDLARAGIKRFKLFDPQKLGFENVSRHEGDLLDVGKYKVHLAAERIYRVNPAIKIETYPENIFERPCEEVKRIFKGSLIVAATDKQKFQLLINELAHQYQIPCVFGGCYEEAKGGEVFFTLPNHNMPCLCCLRGGLRQPPQSQNIDYSIARGPEDYEGQPGLQAAVDFVTCVEILFCLAILLRNSPTSKLARLIDPTNNLMLIGGPLATGFYRFRKPFDIFFQPLSGPRKNCIVCSRDKISATTWKNTTSSSNKTDVDNEHFVLRLLKSILKAVSALIEYMFCQDDLSDIERIVHYLSLKQSINSEPCQNSESTGKINGCKTSQNKSSPKRTVKRYRVNKYGEIFEE